MARHRHRIPPANGFPECFCREHFLLDGLASPRGFALISLSLRSRPRATPWLSFRPRARVPVRPCARRGLPHFTGLRLPVPCPYASDAAQPPRAGPYVP
ncbi:hypothetical protein ZWY2020_038718 [Hordeum vulgare]|nr:hypothetical protein ZWY2020_038718 [Hordeum vulgare]